MDVPLEILDQEVARAAAEASSARARLSRGDALDEPNPLWDERRVSSRSTYLELADSKSPLAAPLRRWIAALTLDRVLWPDTVRLARAWHAASIAVEAPGIASALLSPRALLGRLLAEADPQRRRLWADALARGAHPAADAAQILAERRVEAARLLSVDLGALELPCDPPAAVATLAERLLTETAPHLERASDWHASLAAAVARPFAAGWPARLTSRWIQDLFRPTALTEGLRPALGPLPVALGASSFARALAAFGAAFADAAGPRSPFVMARSPYDLRLARRAALFGALVADPAFGVRALGLGRDAARDQARGVAGALLRTLRLDAAGVLLRGEILLPDRTRFEERTADAVGAPIPPSLAGVLPRLGPEDPARLVGALLAAGDRRRLIERFDEDWFRNPHAARALREEDAAPPVSHLASVSDLDAGLAEITRTQRELG